MDRKCISLHETDTDEHIATQAALVGVKAAADGDADVAADGDLVVTTTGTYVTSRNDVNTANLAAETAVNTKNTKRTAVIKAYNDTAKKVDEKYENDPTHKESLGFKLAKVRAAKGQCEKIEGGKAKQWIHDGFSALTWGSLGTEATFYTIEEYTGDPAVEANWYAANPPQSESAEVIVKPKTLNVPTGWRVTGHNAAGPGVAPSDPFGGKPVH